MLPLVVVRSEKSLLSRDQQQELRSANTRSVEVNQWVRLRVSQATTNGLCSLFIEVLEITTSPIPFHRRQKNQINTIQIQPQSTYIGGLA